MSVWDWLTGKGKRRPTPAPRQSARSKIGASVWFPHGTGGMGTGHDVPRKRNTVRTRIAGYQQHVDGRFDDDEQAAFLLGLWVECRSTWVEAARWDEAGSFLVLRLKGREYTFPGIDHGGALVFAYSDSKGGWFHRVWRGESYRGLNEFPELEAGFLP